MLHTARLPHSAAKPVLECIHCTEEAAARKLADEITVRRDPNGPRDIEQADRTPIPTLHALLQVLDLFGSEPALDPVCVNGFHVVFLFCQALNATVRPNLVA